MIVVVQKLIDYCWSNFFPHTRHIRTPRKWCSEILGEVRELILVELKINILL